MIDWPSIYNAAVLAACGILFLLAIYAIVHSGRLQALADLALRFGEALLERWRERGRADDSGVRGR